jgi:hypothetical protein
MSGHSHSNSISSSRGETATGSGRLPRIKTSMADNEERERERGAPRSAPINGPLRLPDASFAQNGPMRSSSSPEPRLSNRSSYSPTDYRPDLASGTGPSASALGPPGPSTRPPPHPQTQPPGVLIPPRSSSQTEYSRPITPESGSRHTHESENAADLTPRHTITMPSGPVRKASTNGAQGMTTPRSKRHDPAYCGQCGNVVHGQFVRAMGKVYHLECFRCKVSWGR